MLDKKKQVFAIVLLVLVVSLIYAFQSKNFTVDLTSENLSFFENDNITRNLTIYKNADVTSATLNISGFKIEEGTYTNESFNISTETVNPLGMTQNGTYIWVVDGQEQFVNDDFVYKYFMNFTYTGERFNTSNETKQAMGITQDGTFFWITDLRSPNSVVLKYYMINNSYTGETFNLEVDSQNVRGITQNGTFIWLIINTGNVYQYFQNGTFDKVIFTANIVSGEYIGITQDGTFFWVTHIKSSVLKYYMINNSYTGEIFNVSNETTNLKGITQNDTFIWINEGVSGTDAFVYKYYKGGFITNPYMEIGTPDGTYEWNHTGEFNSTFSPNQTLDFSSVLTTALNSGACDCVGCFLNSTTNNCTIPFLFHSDTLGKLQYSSINITWTESVAPNIAIDSITTTEGTQTFTFDTTITDEVTLSTCWYSVFDSIGEIDSATTENTTFTCNVQKEETVSSFGTFNLTIYANDSSGSENTTTETFTLSVSGGGGGASSGSAANIVVATEGNWTIATDAGTSLYQMNMIPDSFRNKLLFFENLGETDRSIVLSCESVTDQKSLCQYLFFDQDSIDLPAQKEILVESKFTVELPEDITKADYFANIVAIDETGNRGILTVEVNVGTSFFSNLVAKIFSSRNFLGQTMPYLLISLFFATFISLIGHFFVLKKLKVNGAAGFAIIGGFILNFIILAML